MNETQIRKRLPISDNERIITVFRHHWFAYGSVYIFGGFVIIVLIVCSIILGSLAKNSLGLSASAATAIMIIGPIVSLLILPFLFIPIYLLQNEAIVLTEEAILELKKPSIFTNKTSQVNLAHIMDVSVSQDPLGTLLGYGHITIETPGDEDDYEFDKIPLPQQSAKRIIEAHENYSAALESGQIKSTLGQRSPMEGTAWRPENELNQPAPTQQPEPTNNNIDTPPTTS